MKTTIAVNVLVKIDTEGDTISELLSNASDDAMGAVEEALASYNPYINDGWYEWANDPEPRRISVESAAPVVDVAELKRQFRNFRK